MSLIKQYLNAIVLLPAIAFSGMTQASDFYLSGKTSAEIAMERGQEVQKANLAVQPRLEWGSDDWLGLLLMTGWTEQSSSLYPNGLDDSGYDSGLAPANTGDFYAVIEEAWLSRDLDMNGNRGQLRFGKQVLAWGKLDQFRVLDAINPQQFREFVFPDLEKTRIGLWGLWAQMETTLGSAEFFVSPDQTVHEAPLPGSAFEFSAPRYRYGFSRPAGGAIRPTLRRKDPDAFPIGVRLSGRSETVDYNLVAHTGPDHSSVGSLALDFSTGLPQATVTVQNPRRTVLGFSLAKAVENWVFRMEYGLNKDRSFNNLTFGPGGIPVLSISEHDQHQLGIGVDLGLAGNTLLNFQWVFDKVAGAQNGLVRPQTDHFYSIALRRSFLNDKASLLARWTGNNAGSDSLTKVSVDYFWSDELKLKMGFDMARGNPDGVFGQFEDRSRYYLHADHYW